MSGSTYEDCPIKIRVWFKKKVPLEKARGASYESISRVRNQEGPGGVRRTQEEPGRSQGKPGRAQEEPGRPLGSSWLRPVICVEMQAASHVDLL